MKFMTIIENDLRMMAKAKFEHAPRQASPERRQSKKSPKRGTPISMGSRHNSFRVKGLLGLTADHAARRCLQPHGKLLKGWFLLGALKLS